MAKKKILYVDDEQFIMEGIVDSLSVDYDVITARSGDEALNIIEAGSHSFDLILLDIMMPPGERVKNSNRGRTSGVEFARIVFCEMKLDIPTVVYTVLMDRSVHDELYSLGIKQVVSKKKLPSDLEKIIHKYI